MRQPASLIADQRDIIRGLAHRVREIADLPEMARRREQWIRHNALCGTQPMILCFPEGAWDELVPERSATCVHPALRRWEIDLRRKIFWWDHIRDDAAIEPHLDLYWRLDVSNYGVEVPMIWGDQRGSYAWDPPIKNLETDFARLRPRTFAVNRAETERELDFANTLVGDILPPRIRGRAWWTVGLTQTLVFLIGLQEMMVAMIDQPQSLHRILGFLRDDTLRFLEWLESERLLTPQNEADYVGSGGLGYTGELPGRDANEHSAVDLRDLWGFAESQETLGISPMMFEEFVMPYQAPLLARFGLNCYGCCEGLERRIDVVLQNVPRLRRVSVAPRANQEALAAKLGGAAIFSRKADPIPVCLKADNSVVRADLRHTLAVAGDQPLEIILKDTHTVQGDPERLGQWVRMAREEVDRRCAERG